MNFDSQSSATYQTISNLLRHIENLGFPKSDWCIYDFGQTLELTAELYNRISETPEFKAFESIGGCHYLQDDDPFKSELDGISPLTFHGMWKKENGSRRYTANPNQKRRLKGKVITGTSE